MSELQKRIQKVQRREVSGGIGFGQVKREQPRAMLLAATVKDTAGAKAAIDAGADVVLFDGLDAGAAAAAIKPLEKACAGAKLASLDLAGAKALQEAGCDFAVSTLESTASAAVDSEKMGQVIVASDDHTDTTLRALGPLGLDALYFGIPGGPMTLAAQLELVRVASFASAPLIVPVAPGATIDELRVLRDSGVAVALAPAGASAEQLKAMVEALKAVPAPKKGNRGGEIAMIPSMAHRADEEEPDEVEEPE